MTACSEIGESLMVQHPAGKAGCHKMVERMCVTEFRKESWTYNSMASNFGGF